MISEDLKSCILRYYYAEQWRVGTICRVLHVHDSTVKRILAHAGVSKDKLQAQSSMIDPYKDFIQATLTKYPTLTARRLYEMVKTRGYPGGPDHFRHVIAQYRPKRETEAYCRLRTLPGEQAQVDWGHFGHITVGRAKRPLMAFVMVLSYSRQIFLQFYLNAQRANFLRGHEAAFTAFGGVPKVLLYDNLRSAVLERQGDAIRFNPELLTLAAHYHFEPRPVAVARGNEKGRVERAIRYIRDNFFAARTYADVVDLNAQAQAWCNGIAADRLCPEDRAQTVRETFIQEQPRLLALPDNPYPCHEHLTVQIGKTPYARFDGNDYSVPHTCVRRPLTVNATLDTVTLVDGITVVATHPRSFDKGQHIEEEAHIKALVARKRRARKDRGQHRLIAAVPHSQAFLNAAAQRQYCLKTLVRESCGLLDTYGADALNAAMQAALAGDCPHTNAVRLHCEKSRDERHEPPPVPLTLSHDKRLSEQVVACHDLQSYNTLQNITSHKETTDE